MRLGYFDRNAPSSSESSLGAESVRNGRPSTDDSVVEAMDEETPGLAGNCRGSLAHKALVILGCRSQLF
jgi:hypothetical protein